MQQVTLGVVPPGSTWPQQPHLGEFMGLKDPSRVVGRSCCHRVSTRCTVTAYRLHADDMQGRGQCKHACATTNDCCRGNGPLLVVCPGWCLNSGTSWSAALVSAPSSSCVLRLVGHVLRCGEIVPLLGWALAKCVSARLLLRLSNVAHIAVLTAQTQT